MPIVNDIAPLSPPVLVDGVAKCIDEFVLLGQTQDQLYEAIRAEMEQFHMKTQAFRTAHQRSPDPEGFAKFMEALMHKRMDWPDTKDRGLKKPDDES